MEKKVFLFAGDGIYQRNMLKKLAQIDDSMRVFIEEFTEVCNEKSVPLMGNEDTTALRQLRTFASEVAIYCMWKKLGCEPDFLIGSSLGEYAAAYCAGVMDIESAFRLILLRNTILKKSENILSMCSVSINAEEVMKIASESGITVSIAAYNAPELVTVVGKGIRRFCAVLKERKVPFNPILVNGGSHCEFFADEFSFFMKEAEGIVLRKPQIEIISSVDTSYTHSDIAYWFDHIIKPVQFSRAMNEVIERGAGFFLDLGVSPVMLGMAMNNTRKKGIKWLATIKSGADYCSNIESAKENFKRIIQEEKDVH